MREENDRDKKINIYEHGHFEGTKFMLNEPIQIPGGGSAQMIDFTAVLDQLQGHDGILEAMIAGFLDGHVLANSAPLSEEEAAELDPQIGRYN